MLPRVSIVISTLDRAPHVRRLLTSLRHLEYPTFEVVVVNGPSTDETEAVLAEFAGEIKVARCPEANLSRSRNIGIAAAAGDLVAFIDDDALPGTPDWLAALVAPLAADPHVAACGGPVVAGDGEHREFDGGATSDYGLQAFAESDLARLGVTLDGRRWVRRVAGGNCVFRRDALIRLGGFDEVYSYYLDETDISLRVTRAGFGIAVSADGFVRHYRARSTQRRSTHDIGWNVIARSDTYYALKNGADPLPRRLITTLRLAPRKHFFREIGQGRRQGLYGRGRWLRYLGRWARGVVAGLWLGLTNEPRTPLGPGTPPPAAFVPFPHVPPGRRLQVGLLARVYPPHQSTGGIARYTQELAHGLHALGHEVHVFTESEQPLRREGMRVYIHGVRPEASPALPEQLTTDKNLRWALAVAGRVIDLARQGTALDLVESPNWDAEGAALRRSHLVPMVVRIHSPLPAVAESERWVASRDLDASVKLERWLIATADGVSSSTEGVVATVRDAMRIDPRRFIRHAKIPLGVPPGPPPRAEPSGRRLLFVGRLERRKGIETLLAVLPRLLERDGALRVDLVGADVGVPSFRRHFETEHKRASWRTRCRFHGVVDDETLVRFYEACTVFVAPSLYESFGLIYLEAMRYGKPVIGCRAGGIPEVVCDGETGLLVPPGDTEALFDAILRLLGDRALRERLGAQARLAVEANFSSRAMAERTEAFYLEVLAHAGDRYHPGLARLRAEAIDLGDAQRVRFTGDWRVEVGDGRPCRVAITPGSTILLSLPACHTLIVRFLGHSGAGVVSLDRAGHRQYFDLYREGGAQALLWEVPLGEARANGPVTCSLKVETEANPLASSREVWVQDIAFCP